MTLALLALIVIVMCIIPAVIVAAACILSSKWSRWEESGKWLHK